MIKSLVLIMLFFVLVYKYIKLHKNYIKQREYFIKTLSHDLRVAIIAQIRGLELAEKNNDLSLLPEINDASKYSLEMVTTLLNTYRIEQGEQILNCECFNPEVIINNIVKSSASFLAEKGIKLEIVKNANAFIEADKDLFSKMLKIIIATALANTQNKKKLSINLLSSDENLNIKISYEGQALSEEEINRIFMSNSKFSTVGHGIKMNFAKKIVDFHKGKFSVLKELDGLNSFLISIPKRQKGLLKTQNISKLAVKY